MVVAESGAGLSSLLNQLAAKIEDDGREVARVRGNEADDVGVLIERIVATIAQSARETRGEGPSLAESLESLRELSAQHSGALVVVDELSGPTGHELFGRMRDELWDLDLQWLVGVADSQQGVLLTPPADAFFETVDHLDPLSESDLVDLLTRRDPENELGGDLKQQIASTAAGNPARTLALARRVLVADPEQRQAIAASDPIQAIEAQLGEPAARLYAELLRHGPSGPSEQALLKRMSWSRPRAYQVFRDLEAARFVRSRSERSGRAGRPRKVYEAVLP